MFTVFKCLTKNKAYKIINGYVVVKFLSQVIFIFLLFQLHSHTLPYPKSKENQKSEIARKVLPFINFTNCFRSLHGSELTYFWKLCQAGRQQLTFFNQAREIGPQAWDRSFQPAGVRLTPKAWELARIYTQLKPYHSQSQYYYGTTTFSSYSWASGRNPFISTLTRYYLFSVLDEIKFRLLR